jgi:hypothetical protein
MSIFIPSEARPSSFRRSGIGLEKKKWIRKKGADGQFCTLFLLQILRKDSFFEENLQILLLFIENLFSINMDTGPSDVRPIFGKNFPRQTHIFIEIFHKKFPIFFSLWINLQKIKDFLEIL